jgi:hypothetical protein
MPVYNITARRDTHYEFTIEADTEEEALEEINRIELSEDVEEYAYDWYPLEIDSIEEEEQE